MYLGSPGGGSGVQVPATHIGNPNGVPSFALSPPQLLQAFGEGTSSWKFSAFQMNKYILLKEIIEKCPGFQFSPIPQLWPLEGLESSAVGVPTSSGLRQQRLRKVEWGLDGEGHAAMLSHSTLPVLTMSPNVGLGHVPGPAELTPRSHVRTRALPQVRGGLGMSHLQLLAQSLHFLSLPSHVSSKRTERDLGS